MSEHRSVLSAVLSSMLSGTPAKLAVVVERRGSAPRGVGAMIAVFPDGSSCGTIGGGTLEYEIVRSLVAIETDGMACIRSFQLVPERDGMPCGGSLTLLLTKLSATAIPVFTAAAAALEAGNGCTLQVCLDDSGQACWSVDLPKLTAVQCYSIHLQPVPELLICGAGHIGQALAPMALIAGFRVTVLDDRAELLGADRFPDSVAIVAVAGFDGCLQCQQITAATSVLIVTYGHQHDRMVLEQALATDAGYIGMVGSRRKREELFGQLRAAGVSDEDLLRVHCPVGLPIGAETPAEIAVSILAEMIAVRRSR